MTNNNCSYCQREYGTISLNRKIYRTYDHLKAKNSNKKRKYAFLGYKGIDNLIDCCNECNNLKQNYYPKVFKRKLNETKYVQQKCAKYLTPQLVKTIQNSIDVLSKNQPQPIEMRVYQHDLLI